MILAPDSDIWTDYPRYVENVYQVFATVLYDAANGKAIWSAESETAVDGSEKKSRESYVKAMIKRMENKGLIAL